MDGVAIIILKLKDLVKHGQHWLKMQDLFRNGKCMTIKDQKCHVKFPIRMYPLQCLFSIYFIFTDN